MEFFARKDKRNVMILILIVILLIIVFVFFTVVIVYSMNVVYSSNALDGEDEIGKLYRYSIFEPSRNQTTFGAVSLPQHLEMDEYITYSDSVNNIVLINNFGTEEYQCTGSCFCEQEERREATTTILTRGLILLVSMLTSVISYKLAEEYFEKECLQRYSSECSTGMIRGSVESCENVLVQASSGKKSKGKTKKRTGKSKEVEEVEGPTWDLSGDEDDDSKFRFWMCQGNCLPKQFKKAEDVLAATKFECRRLQSKGEVLVEKVDNLFKEEEREAGFEFLKHYLRPYCKEQSSTKYWDIDPETRVAGWKVKHMCVGTTGAINPTIRCFPASKKKDKKDEKV